MQVEINQEKEAREIKELRAYCCGCMWMLENEVKKLTDSFFKDCFVKEFRKKGKLKKSNIVEETKRKIMKLLVIAVNEKVEDKILRLLKEMKWSLGKLMAHFVEEEV